MELKKNTIEQKILICNAFDENTCTRKTPLDFEDIDKKECYPGEMLIESLWRIEAKRSFIDQKKKSGLSTWHMAPRSK
jgi:hypothetical protein